MLAASQIPPALPCVECRHKGSVTRDGLYYPCDACNGAGVQFCTMDDVRKEYRCIRTMLCRAYSIDEKEFDKKVQKRVERAKFVLGDVQQEIWFDVAYHMARDDGHLEEWWKIARFGRK